MNIVVVSAYDWQGAYLDGVLLTQNHSLSAIELLRAMDGYRIHEGRLVINVVQVDEEWFKEVEYFPEMLSDVKIKGAY